MAAPNNSSEVVKIGPFPIVTYTATYQINSGTAIAAGATVTETVTFTGLAVGDEFAVAPRAATVIPDGLKLTSLDVTATNTATFVWTNTNSVAVTPPASGTWYCTVFAPQLYYGQ